MIPLESIKKFIFPNNVNCYFKIEENNENLLVRKGTDHNISSKFEKIDFSENRDGIPISYRAVFSSNSLQDLKIKKVQNGFAYTFYRKFSKQKFFKNKICTFYVPFTFFVISEFSFYKSFEKLFRCIRKIYSQESIYPPGTRKIIPKRQRRQGDDPPASFCCLPGFVSHCRYAGRNALRRAVPPRCLHKRRMEKAFFFLENRIQTNRRCYDSHYRRFVL